MKSRVTRRFPNRLRSNPVPRNGRRGLEHDPNLRASLQASNERLRKAGVIF